MPTLRQIVDEQTIFAASPLAQSVSKTMQDPVGNTKDQFGKLQKAKLQYDMAREEAQRNIAPVQSVISHLSQMHGIQPGMGTPGMDMPGQQMGPDGQPLNPDMQPGYEDETPPTNMNQTIGKMNQARPSLVGHQPGVAPGDGQTVRPPKMGQPTPGGGGATRAGNPSTQQFGPKAAKPKGSGSMGKKSSGNGKSSGKNSGGVNITVHSSAVPVIKASNTIEKHFGFESLRASSVAELEAGGPGSGRRPSYGWHKQRENESRDDHTRRLLYHVYKDADSAQAAANLLKDKGYSYRPDMRGPNTHVLVHTKKSLDAAGSMKGAKKGWSTRGKGHLSAKEKSAHYDKMESFSMSPGGGGGFRGVPGGGPIMGPSKSFSPGGAGGGMRPPVRTGGGMQPMNRGRLLSKKMKAGPAQLADKVDEPGDELALNPVMRGSHKKACMCAKCMKGRKSA